MTALFPIIPTAIDRFFVSLKRGGMSTPGVTVTT